ncbi:MAG: radical SAM protein, partial [Clostridia bacterium]|nr:radical SAM protein [Clostridia bacterium]
MAKITAIDKGSIGEELGLEVGDELIGFNGEKIVDILDYVYYDSQEFFTLNLKAKQGEAVDIEIEKDESETLGLTLDESVELEPMRCKNKCAFCFVDQLPKGMRDTLYVKDDDYRLSFVSGNYVTLSNIGQKELDRIVKLHLSPLYISVHAYDKEVKTKLVANPESAKVFEKMKFLAERGIQMHTQIVLCKDFNDGDILKQTLEELYKLSPYVQTVAIIPVGLTCHR